MVNSSLAAPHAMCAAATSEPTSPPMCMRTLVERHADRRGGLRRGDRHLLRRRVRVEEPGDRLGVHGFLGLPHLQEVGDDRIAERRAVRADAGDVAVGEPLDIADVDERGDHAFVELAGPGLGPVQVVDPEQLGALEEALAAPLVLRSELLHRLPLLLSSRQVFATNPPSGLRDSLLLRERRTLLAAEGCGRARRGRRSPLAAARRDRWRTAPHTCR